MMVWYALLVIAGYLIGSIPFGLYTARFSFRRDRRLAGRATANVSPMDLYRLSGPGRPSRRVAGIAFLLELAKGFLPTFTGYLALGTPGAVGGGSAALVGHTFPFFGRLRGSNSVAPLLGVLLAVYPVVVVILGMVWTAALAAWRYASLAALVTATVSPLALAALEVGASTRTWSSWPRSSGRCWSSSPTGKISAGSSAGGRRGSTPLLRRSGEGGGGCGDLANQLTLVRLVAVVPVMAALYLEFPGNRALATVRLLRCDPHRLPGRHPGPPAAAR